MEERVRGGDGGEERGGGRECGEERGGGIVERRGVEGEWRGEGWRERVWRRRGREVVL